VWSLAAVLALAARPPHREGELFRAFMVAYLGFRLLLEFLKPGILVGGLNPIQWVCLSTLLYYGWQVRRALRPKEMIASG
jgi:phosphatidylglycerol---prolipoprotein diacylglyceryl transferase